MSGDIGRPEVVGSAEEGDDKKIGVVFLSGEVVDGKTNDGVEDNFCFFNGDDNDTSLCWFFCAWSRVGVVVAADVGVKKDGEDNDNGGGDERREESVLPASAT